MEPEKIDFLEQPEYSSHAISGTPEIPRMVRYLMATGIIKTEKQADITLKIIAITAFAVAIGLFGYYVLGIGATDTGFVSRFPPALKEQLQK